MMLDLNRAIHKATVINVAINEAMDRAVLARSQTEPPRQYLGASSIGDECLRKIHWQWRRPKPVDKASTARVFARGHIFEKMLAEQFVLAGFNLQRGGPETEFTDADGRFRGHCDGIFRSGPELDGGGYPALWECKALGEKSWKQIERDGLKKAKPAYYAQVQLYMAYLELTDNPTIFSALNVENGQLVNLLIPFSPADAQAAIDRAVIILRADQANETLPRVTDDPSDFRCRFCSYSGECWSNA